MSEGLISDNQSRGLQSSSGASTEDQCADAPNQPKVSSGPAFLNLSRCSACYRQTHQWVDHGESSSSAEDSGPDEDWESEAESSSSSSCSLEALSEILEKPETENPFPGAGDAAEPELSEEDESRTKGMTRRAPLVKSFSLPTSLTPYLIPLSLLPRPHRVVSTLNLEVLSQNDDEAFYTIKQYMSEAEEKKKEINTRGEFNNLMPPQIGLPWQHRSHPTLEQHQLSYQYQQQPHQQSNQYQQQPHQLSYQYQQQPHQQSYQYQQQPHQLSYQYQQQPHQQSYQYQQQPHQLLHQHQQQQPQHFPLLSAQGQRLPPPLHTLPVLHPPAHHAPLQVPIPPQTHLHALTSQTCLYCYSMNFPYSP